MIVMSDETIRETRAACLLRFPAPKDQEFRGCDARRCRLCSRARPLGSLGSDFGAWNRTERFLGSFQCKVGRQLDDVRV